MSQAVTVPPFVNRAMKFVLRSPLHGMISKSILLFTFTGRKSGRTYTTPVSYSQYGNRVHVFTHANWWKNLRGGTPVKLRIQGREVVGLPELVVDDKKTVAAGLMEHLQHVPSDAGYYDVTFDDTKKPRAEEVEKGAQTVVMIRVGLC